MKTLYFFINGSGSPFWLEERKNNIGGTYFWGLFWPENPTVELKNEWHKIYVLFQTYSNPIDSSFPSLWTQSMCDVFNQLVEDFIKLSNEQLSDYQIINRYSKLTQDERLIVYRQDILKSHLNNNIIINNETEFKDYFNFRNEFNSTLSSEIPFETILRIERSEFDSLNRITLRFGSYDNFQVSICPFSFRTFITDINIGGHYPIYQLIRIQRDEMLSNPEKIIELGKLFYV